MQNNILTLSQYIKSTSDNISVHHSEMLKAGFKLNAGWCTFWHDKKTNMSTAQAKIFNKKEQQNAETDRNAV